MKKSLFPLIMLLVGTLASSFSSGVHGEAISFTGAPAQLWTCPTPGLFKMTAFDPIEIDTSGFYRTAGDIFIGNGTNILATINPCYFPYLVWGSSGSGDGQFSEITDIAFSASSAAATSNDVYVADYANNRISQFTITDTLGVTFDGWLGNCTAGTNCDVANMRSIGFTCTSATCTATGGGNGPGQMDGPQGIAFDSTGNLYVTNGADDKVQKFDSTGAFVTSWGSPGTANGQFNDPWGIATYANNVYVADSSNARVQMFDDTGKFVGLLGASAHFTGPAGIEVDQNAGFVYVADLISPPSIQKFTTSGAFVTKWGSFGAGKGQLDFPISVAVDYSGNIFVTDAQSRVQEFGYPVVLVVPGTGGQLSSGQVAVGSFEGTWPASLFNGFHNQVPTGWTLTGGPTTTTGAPVMCSGDGSAGSGGVNVVANDGTTLWHGAYSLNSGFFAGTWTWESIGGATNDPPSCAVQNGVVYVVARAQGADSLWYTSSTVGSGIWAPWVQFPDGSTPSGPTLITDGNQLQLFVRGGDSVTPGDVYQKTYAGGAWVAGWTDLGGQTMDPPAAVSNCGIPGHLDRCIYVAAHGGNDFAWIMAPTPYGTTIAQSSWVPLTLPADSTPTLFIDTSNHFHLVSTFGGAVFHLSHSGNPFPDWVNPVDPTIPNPAVATDGLGGQTTGHPALAFLNSYPMIFVQGGDQRVWYMILIGGTWVGWYHIDDDIFNPPLLSDSPGAAQGTG